MLLRIRDYPEMAPFACWKIGILMKDQLEYNEVCMITLALCDCFIGFWKRYSGINNGFQNQVSIYKIFIFM